jgi:phosphatidylinositol alpha-mannosyltransferase
VVHVLAPSDRAGDTSAFRSVGRTVAIHDNGTVTRISLTPSAGWRTARLIRREAYDIVHVHEPMLPAVGVGAVLATGSAAVGTFHMSAASARWYRAFRPVVRWASEHLNVKLAVSETARRFVGPFVAGPIRVVPLAVDWHALRCRPRGGPRVVFVGRPEPRKGLEVLLRALGLMRVPVTLDVIGVRPDQAPELAAGTASQVRFHGRVPEAEKRRLLQRASVLCAPSLGGESFGLVLLEGMAAGLAVVASDLPGYRAAVTPSCARLVPPGDPAALSRALDDTLRHPEQARRLGEAGLLRAAEFDVSRVADTTLAIYRDAIG